MSGLPLRGVAALTVLPLALLLTSTGYYLARNARYGLYTAQGHSIADLTWWYTAEAVAGPAGCVAAGVLAALVGPRIVAGLASLLCAALCVGWLVPGADLVGVGGALLSAARAAVSVGLLAACLDAFPDRFRSMGVVAVALGTVGVNVGATIAFGVASAIGRPPLWVGLASALFLVTAPVAALEALPAPSPPDTTRRLDPARAALAVGAVALLTAPQVGFWILAMVPWTWEVSPSDAGTAGTINAAVAAGTALVVAVAWVVAQLTGVRVPPAVGLPVAMAGVVAFAVVILARPVGFLPAVAVGAVVEGLVVVFGVAAAGSGVHWRLAPLLVAGWLVAGRIVAAVPYDDLPPTTPYGLAAVALAGTVAAAGLAAAAVIVERRAEAVAGSAPAHEPVVGGGHGAEVEDP